MLEVMRQPLAAGRQGRHQLTGPGLAHLPDHIMLIAAANPCLCG
jgi:predicted ATPase with chaperone activity